MCRNHSHLIARFLGEDSTLAAPVLTFILANKEILIESPDPGGMKLTLNSSGVLYLPSWVADGSFRSLEPPTGGARISLFLLPEGVLTTTLTAMNDFLNSSSQYATMQPTAEDSPIPVTGATDEEDAPF